MNALEAHQLTKVYDNGRQRLRVLDNLSFTVARDEFLVIAGDSGSGKTTLLSLLSGIDKPTSGRIVLLGRDITELSEDELAPMRNTAIGFVFQSFHLVPSLTALENVMLPAELKGDADADERAARLLQRVGLAERGAHFPGQLSGGEKQRVAICRALINYPRIIFADEPTGNLDTGAGERVLNLLVELKREHNAALVCVTHSHGIAARADRVLRLVNGRLAEE